MRRALEVVATGIALSFAIRCDPAVADTYSISVPPYTHVSNYYAPCQEAPCGTYTTAMAISGYFTTDSPLPPDKLGNISALVTGFAFTDGLNTYRSDDPNVRMLAIGVTTNNSGALIGYAIDVSKWHTGSAPHAYPDRLSRISASITANAVHVTAYHNWVCFNTWTPPFGGSADTCQGSGSTNSASIALYDPGAPPQWSKRPVVEYFNPGFGHYFMSADPDEITGLDGGAFGGAFTRTGLGFSAYEGPTEGTIPVCRFFTTPGTFGAKSSHFYTANVSECEGLKSNPNWIYEKVAFYVYPMGKDACTGGGAPVYRMYNHGQTGAPNHRFTTDEALYTDFTTTKGWDPEGIAFCAVYPPYNPN